MIIVKDLSRLGRNNSKVSYYLEEYFPIHKVRFIAVNNDYDSYIENASLEYAWLTNGMNESYCLDISKKVRSALKVRKEKGYFTGWKAPYGYQRSQEDYHKLVIDTQVSNIVKRIFKMAYDGMSASQIADILSSEKIPNPSNYANIDRGIKTDSYQLWCARTISEMLSNETYIGNLTQGRSKKINYKVKKEIRLPKEEWIIVENTHEPIIDKNTFYTVQNLLKKNRKMISENKRLLTGFLFCKECGHSLSITKSNDGKRAYTGCTYYRKYSKFHLCTPHTINYQKLEDTILKKLKDIFDSEICKEKIIQKLLSNNQCDKKVIELKQQIEIEKKNIASANKLISSAYIDMKKGIIDLKRYKWTENEINNNIANYKKSLHFLKQELIILKQNQKKEAKDYPKLLEVFLSCQHLPRNFLVDIIDKIYVNESKKIEIHFRFKALHL